MAEIEHISSQNGGDESIANGLTNGVVNGTNGHSEESSSKDKHKSSHRDKDRHSSSHKSSHKDKSHDKERHKSSSDKHKSSHKDKSSDKDRHKSSSDKDRHKSSSDKDRHKSSSDKDKDRHKSSSDKDKDRHKSSSSDKDKHRDKDRERSDKDRSDKDKERSDKDKDRSDKDKERSDKHKSSSSKDKDRHSSSNGHKESSDKKDRHRDKDRHHSSSKSSHKDKHRDKDRHREKSRDEKEKSSHSSEMKDVVKEEPPMSEVDTTQDSIDGSVFSKTMDTSQDTTVEDMSFKREEAAVRGEVSADSEEEDKLIINVKEEPMQINNSMDDADDDLPLTSRMQPKQEIESEEEDDIPLSNRKRPKYEPEQDDEDDVPLISRKKVKKEELPSDDDDIPLAARKKTPTSKKKKRKQQFSEEEDSEDDFKPVKKAKVKKEVKARGREAPKASPTKRGTGVKKEKKISEEEKHIWKWWEEEKPNDGRKWSFLEHKGIVFADPYVRIPSNVQMKYDGKYIALSQDAEEVAGFYARMLEHDYVTKEVFNTNFFKDFRKSMTSKEKELITDLSKCDFKKMHTYFLGKTEERKSMTKEEKKVIKERNEDLVKEFGWCTIDGHKQKIGNFRAEPPGLFRGRGEHPKMGMLKRRIMPEDVIINCSKDSVIPAPPKGHKWKEVRHDNSVTWLACWVENVQGQTKYVMMSAASKLKGEKDWMKYETARRLHQIVDRIRDQYKSDWKSKEMRIRQRSVALYFIDKLALRAGNEKDEDQADTVGCCSLRVEHITLYDEKDGRECVVAFDFLGKDSIRYYNEVAVEKRVFKNLRLFMENKAPGDDLFDRLNTQIMNSHLSELMDGLTAKVFRTYNASITLQQQLQKLTDPDDEIPSKILSYNRANREVAILCNHQRAVPKTYDQSMANLQKKIDDKKELIEAAEKDLKVLKRQAKSGGSMTERAMADKKKKQIDRLNDQLNKLEISATDKEENKQIALGTSKLNYLDPRISVAWAKKYDIPIEKVYNKTQRLKFQWALEMATEDYDFTAAPTSKIVNNRQNNSMDDGEDNEDFED